MPGLRRVDGLQELTRALKKLPSEMRGRPLISATRAGARLIADDARNRVPVDTGNLRDNIGVFAIPKRRMPSGFDYGVEIRGNEKGKAGSPGNAYYWRFIEIEVGAYNRPATPFLRPALATQSQAAIRAFTESFSRRLDTIARKART